MNDFEKLQEISRLLDEAYKHYFSYESHCKSSEGAISVSFGNYWERGDDPGNLVITNVEIYSYVLGPNRSHDFDSVDDALAAVREWHTQEMAYEFDAPENVQAREEFGQAASEWVRGMIDSGKMTVINVTDLGQE